MAAYSTMMVLCL